MCGIAGALSLLPRLPGPPGSPDSAVSAGPSELFAPSGLPGRTRRPLSGHVLDLLRGQQHRGPDETRLRSYDGISVGVCRLSIVGGESGSQPVSVDCRGPRRIVAFNGEIYNYRDVRADLPGHHRFTGSSDSEVLAHAFEEWGITCLGRFNGMFAICARDDTATYLIRDRFGVKPLYYTRDDDLLRFSSEARCLASVPARLVLEPTYPDFETGVGFQTPFEGVLEVPPGHYLRVDHRTGAVVLHRYYRLEDFPVEPIDEAEAVQTFRELAEDAVRVRTHTDLGYGVYVSGGLDSSVIACLARPDALFSAVVTDRIYTDERPYLGALCDHLGIACQTVTPDPTAFVTQLVDLVATLDFPVTTLAAFSQYLLSKEASAQGLRIMLSGLGLDEYLGGYTRHAAFLARDRPSLLRAQYPSYAPLLDRLGTAGPSESSVYYALINRSPRPGAEGLAVVDKLFSTQRSPLNRLAATDMAISLPPLLRADDRLNMRFGVESRAPFMDYRLVEFAYRLPDALKVRRTPDGRVLTKYVMRRAFADLLPERIGRRTDKVGFPSAVAVWLAGPLSPVVRRAREIVEDMPQPQPAPWSTAARQASSHDEFSRTSWQVVQWAVWSLLFQHGLDPAEAGGELTGNGRGRSAVREPPPPPRSTHLPSPSGIRS